MPEGNWLEILKNYIDDLETRLTAARAGYLDELAAANIPADVDTILTRLSALRAGYLDELDFDLNARLGTPAGASLAADLLTIDNLVDDLETAVGAIEGATTLHNKLTAARAALLDQITALRLAELDAANMPTDLANILTEVAGLNGDAMRGTDNAALAASWTAALATALGNYTAARAGYIDELAAANLPADVDELKASKGRQLFSMDFWSAFQEEVAIPAIAATLSLPTVTIADLPAGATVVRAIAMVKFRVIENINAGANKLDGATVASMSQVIQVRDDTPGTWRDAITFVDDQFGLAASTREGGDVLIGNTDIAIEVDGNDGYNFQYLLAKADLLGINWNDVQVGLRIWYSV